MVLKTPKNFFPKLLENVNKINILRTIDISGWLWQNNKSVRIIAELNQNHWINQVIQEIELNFSINSEELFQINIKFAGLCCCCTFVPDQNLLIEFWSEEIGLYSSCSIYIFTMNIFSAFYISGQSKMLDGHFKCPTKQCVRMGWCVRVSWLPWLVLTDWVVKSFHKIIKGVHLRSNYGYLKSSLHILPFII